ncbi:MAG: Hpt domain-containing protein [Comamonadaceae bacterium]|nr:Hpt domain-containing protein [Burkholderiales bacterium]MEB2348478.1 Hpt domain-containing protein [Comamonadaceae bacterium]
MADTCSGASGTGADFDPGPVSVAFFDEVAEHLGRMERLLLEHGARALSGEPLDALFRYAHSIKGGAAAFGFSEVVELAHGVESLLDALRHQALAPGARSVEVLLAAVDAARELLAQRQRGAPSVPAGSHGELVERLRALEPPGVAADGVPAVPRRRARMLEVTVGPLDLPELADAVKDLFRDIAGLGTISDLPDARARMSRFAVRTTASDTDLLDLFAFYVARDQVRIRALEPTLLRVHHLPAALPADDETVRVPVHKLDEFADLVRELAAAQAALAKCAAPGDAAGAPWHAGLAELARVVRRLQSSALSVRKVPLSMAFERLPRVLHDLAEQLGKQLTLVTQGEAIELDKSVVEKLVDPLTQLVRNSCDHGIEAPAQRLAAGKRAQGTVTVVASVEKGTAVIVVHDDGRGLSRSQIVQAARERGIDVADTLSDAEVWKLILQPGFSTAAVVTEISGRGVGMDVVRTNIAALGGVVEIASAPGAGMSVSMRLPLAGAVS